MKIKKSKIENMNNYRNILTSLDKVTIFIYLFLGLQFNSYSQSMTYVNNGTYQFTSLFPEADLHFYLYGDGHHSFFKNNFHQYGTYALPANAKLFHAKPYDESTSVDEIELGIADQGVASDISQIIDFQNQIEIKRSWNLVDGQLNYFIVMFENSQFSYPVSGCIEFHYNSGEIVINVSDILDDYGNNWVSAPSIGTSDYQEFSDKFTWNFANLKPNEQRFIYIPAKCVLESMSKIDTRGVMKIDSCDGFFPVSSKTDGSNEDIYDSSTFTLESYVSNFAHDPNCIVTTPECLVEANQDQIVEYKVYFQNDGSDPVADVSVELLIEGGYTSIGLIEASDDCTFLWNNSDVIVYFDDINLKGLSQVDSPNYNETLGWVKLSLCYSSATLNDCTISNGDIFFDYVGAMPISNVLCYDSECSGVLGAVECSLNGAVEGVFYNYNVGNKVGTSIEEENRVKIKISPTVVNSFINIENLEVDGKYQVKILDRTNRVVKEYFGINTFNSEINVGDIFSGLYFIVINDFYQVETYKFVKN